MIEMIVLGMILANVITQTILLNRLVDQVNAQEAKIQSLGGIKALIQDAKREIERDLAWYSQNPQNQVTSDQMVFRVNQSLKGAE